MKPFEAARSVTEPRVKRGGKPGRPSLIVIHFSDKQMSVHFCLCVVCCGS